MKILNIIQCSNLGGMERSTLETMSVLQEAGHEVRMLSLHPVGALKQQADARDLPLEGIAKYRLAGLGNVWDLVRRIRAYNPDRIWLTGHNFGSMIAAGISGVPAYLSIHFHHGDRPMQLWRLFYALARRVCSGIRFISRYIYAEIERLLEGYGNVVCFPNIFPEPVHMMSRVDARNALEIPDDAFVVGNAGWLIPRKAFDVFLKTAALLVERIPRVLFVIAGDGSDRSRLEEKADMLGIRASVVFIGWQQDLSAFYGALDVLLFNSNFDAVGRTPLEALCRGVPVVASVTCGGLDEFIRPGKDGFLIDHHDPTALADEIERLYRDPTYGADCAKSGRSRVLDLGSPARHLEQLTEFMQLK